MNRKYKKEFDANFELLGLLTYSDDPKRHKLELIAQLDDLGLSGKRIFDNHFIEWESVVEEFASKRKLNNSYNFFFSNSINSSISFISFLAILIGNYLTELRDSKTDITRKREIIASVTQELMEEYHSPIKNFDEYLMLLSDLDISESEKWKLMMLYHLPDDYLTSLWELWELNESVYKKIYAKYDFSEQIDQSISLLSESNKNIFSEIFNELSEGAVIYPTFINPLSQIILDNKCYLGILNYEIFSIGTTDEEEVATLLLRLKVLADKSKFQILLSLKEKPKFNLEIAEELQLSPGTISHHMSALLSSEFVSVEKKSGKVYYHLKSNTIKWLTSYLSSLIFD